MEWLAASHPTYPTGSQRSETSSAGARSEKRGSWLDRIRSWVRHRSLQGKLSYHIAQHEPFNGCIKGQRVIRHNSKEAVPTRSKGSQSESGVVVVQKPIKPKACYLMFLCWPGGYGALPPKHGPLLNMHSASVLPHEDCVDNAPSLLCFSSMLSSFNHE